MLTNEELSEWVGGYFNGDGSFSMGVQKSDGYKLNYRIRGEVEVVASIPNIAGVVDAEGYFGTDIAQQKDCKLNHNIGSYFQLTMNTKDDIDRFCSWAEGEGITHSRFVKERKSENRENHICVKISKRGDVKKFIEIIAPYLSKTKLIQAIILYNEIIPRLEKGEVSNKQGFIECVSWIDLQRTFKGARSVDCKYSTEYFEALWDIELPEEQKAPKAEDLLDGSYYKEQRVQEQERKEIVQNAISSIPVQNSGERW